MNGPRFEALIQSTFAPFLARLNFEMQRVQVNGTYCSASFVCPRHTLSITVEQDGERPTVMLLTNGSDDVRSIDDPTKTPRLSNLNAKYMGLVSDRERAENEAFFGQLEARDQVERGLIKCAKELRLVLPHHLSA